MIFSELRRGWRRSLLLGIAAPLFSLMAGVFIQTVFYEVASDLPCVIRQDAHIGLPLCKVMPDLYGCEPGVGALSGLQIWELSQQAGQVGGLLVNLIVVALASMWVTMRVRSDRTWHGLVTGVAGLISSLVLALIIDIPLNIHSVLGIFGILALALLPLSGFVGDRIGKRRLARLLSRRSVRFFPVGETAEIKWAGESLSPRELEVLALVAEGLKNQEIAAQLFISKATVKTHLIHIFSKLGVENRTAAVTQALACGLLRQEKTEKEPD